MTKGVVEAGSRTALVTGAGRGLGRRYADRLASAGYNVVLAGRSDSIFVARDELAKSYENVRFYTIKTDLAETDAAERLYSSVMQLGLKIDVLVNNAGMFSFRDIVSVEESTIERMIFLHNLTLAKLNRLFAADMIERGGGHILNMSSFSIWMPLPGIALYSATKAFVKSFSVAFSKEVRDKKVYVTAICPAGIATDLYGLSRRFQALGVKVGALMTPDNCARRSLRALWNHRRFVVPDWWNIFMIPLMMHLPGFVERLIRDKTMKYQK